MFSESDSTFECAIKICIIGAANVGKTCICLRAFDDIFQQDYLYTVGPESHEKIREFQLQNKIVRISLWDGPGSPQRTNDSKKNAILRGCQGAFIVFDLTSRESFEQVSSFSRDLSKYARSAIMVLLGNKADLPQREVREEEGTALAQKIGCRLYLETSASTGEGVFEAMSYLEQWCVEALFAGEEDATGAERERERRHERISSTETLSQLAAQSGFPSLSPPAPSSSSSTQSPPSNQQGSQGQSVGSPSRPVVGTIGGTGNPWSDPRYLIRAEVSGPERANLSRWYVPQGQRLQLLKSFISQLSLLPAGLTREEASGTGTGVEGAAAAAGEEENRGEQLLLYPQHGGAPRMCLLFLSESAQLSPRLCWRYLGGQGDGKYVEESIAVTDIAEVRPPGLPLPYPLRKYGIPANSDARGLLFAVIAKEKSVVFGALSEIQVAFVVTGLKLLADNYVLSEEKALRGKQDWNQARFVALRDAPSAPLSSARIGDAHRGLRQGIVVQRFNGTVVEGEESVLWLYEGRQENPPGGLNQSRVDTEECPRLVLSTLEERGRIENSPTTPVFHPDDNFHTNTTMAEWLLYTVGAQPYSSLHRMYQKLFPQDCTAPGLRSESLEMSDISEVRADPSDGPVHVIGSERSFSFFVEPQRDRDLLVLQLQGVLFALRPSLRLF